MKGERGRTVVGVGSGGRRLRRAGRPAREAGVELRVGDQEVALGAGHGGHAGDAEERENDELRASGTAHDV